MYSGKHCRDLIVRDLSVAALDLAEGKLKKRLGERIAFMQAVKDLAEREDIEMASVVSLFSSSPIGSIQQKLKYLVEGPTPRDLEHLCSVADRHIGFLSEATRIMTGLAKLGILKNTRAFAFQQASGRMDIDVYNSTQSKAFKSYRPILNLVCALSMLEVKARTVVLGDLHDNLLRHIVFASICFQRELSIAPSIEYGVCKILKKLEPETLKTKVLIGEYRGRGLNAEVLRRGEAAVIRQKVEDWLELPANMLQSYKNAR